MNVQQVIEYLEDSKCAQSQGEAYQELHDTALNIAIEALRRQIPAKVGRVVKTEHYDIGDYKIAVEFLIDRVEEFIDKTLDEINEFKKRIRVIRKIEKYMK